MNRNGRWIVGLLLAVLGGGLSCDGSSPLEPEPVDLTGLTLILAPQHGGVHWDGSRQFTAVGRRADGSDVRIPITWSVVSGPGSIDRNGVLTVKGPPTGDGVLVTVRAASGELSATATLQMVNFSTQLEYVTVRPNPTYLKPGQSRQFNVVGSDFFGNEPQMPRVTWSVAGGDGSIDSRGFFTAGAATGEFQVRATAAGKSGVATVFVTNTPPPYINVPLGLIRTNGIIAATSVTCVEASVGGDISVSPGTTIEGNCPSERHAGDAMAAQAQADASAAFTYLTNLPCDATRSLPESPAPRRYNRGVYCADGDLRLTGDIELDADGDTAAVFVFQVADSLDLNADFHYMNGAWADHVYFVVGDGAALRNNWGGIVIANGSVAVVDDGLIGTGRVVSRTGAVTAPTNIRSPFPDW